MKQAMSTHLGEALGRDFFSVREQYHPGAGHHRAVA